MPQDAEFAALEGTVSRHAWHPALIVGLTHGKKLR